MSFQPPRRDKSSSSSKKVHFAPTSYLEIDQPCSGYKSPHISTEEVELSSSTPSTPTSHSNSYIQNYDSQQQQLLMVMSHQHLSHQLATMFQMLRTFQPKAIQSPSLQNTTQQQLPPPSHSMADVITEDYDVNPVNPFAPLQTPFLSMDRQQRMYESSDEENEEDETSEEEEEKERRKRKRKKKNSQFQHQLEYNLNYYKM